MNDYWNTIAIVSETYSSSYDTGYESKIEAYSNGDTKFYVDDNSCSIWWYNQQLITPVDQLD